MENNRIIPTKPIPDDKLKKEIENFKFFVQYGNFKDFKDYKNGANSSIKQMSFGDIMCVPL